MGDWNRDGLINNLNQSLDMRNVRAPCPRCGQHCLHRRLMMWPNVKPPYLGVNKNEVLVTAMYVCLDCNRCSPHPLPIKDVAFLQEQDTRFEVIENPDLQCLKTGCFAKKHGAYKYCQEHYDPCGRCADCLGSHHSWGCGGKKCERKTLEWRKCNQHEQVLRYEEAEASCGGDGVCKFYITASCNHTAYDYNRGCSIECYREAGHDGPHCNVSHGAGAVSWPRFSPDYLGYTQCPACTRFQAGYDEYNKVWKCWDDCEVNIEAP